MQLHSHIEIAIDWADYQWYPAEHIYANPEQFFVLWLLLDGEIRLSEGEERTLTPGVTYLFAPCPRRAFVTPHGATWFSIGFHPTSPATVHVLQQLHAPVCWHPDDEMRDSLSALMQHLIREYHQQGTASEVICFGLMQAVIGLLQRLSLTWESTLLASPWPEWLIRSLDIIERQPNISVTALAAETRYSVAHFRALFNRYMGISPHACLQRRQLHAAQTLLATTELTITAIAAHLGYDSPSHFARVFTQHIGMPPTEYRKAKRQLAQRHG